jgi:hypothetical protein
MAPDRGSCYAVTAGPGVKMFPSVLPSGEVAFLRADVQAQGVFIRLAMIRIMLRRLAANASP